MEEKIYHLLLQMQSDMKDMQSDMKVMQSDMKVMRSDIKGMNTDIKGIDSRLIRVEDTVNRIEVSQTEDGVGILQHQKKKTDLDHDFLNSKINTLERKVYQIERQLDN
ncbi:hypothetical protein [Cytobacillus gottheilii]|uniref:hypothetical protein n=1 Tax=Cytobacillus gottheilii TaxID=859144 RepID=UPI00082A0B53|nr:hypothetical protein [Cytobacillus gottheilii]